MHWLCNSKVILVSTVLDGDGYVNSFDNIYKTYIIFSHFFIYSSHFMSTSYVFFGRIYRYMYV